MRKGDARLKPDELTPPEDRAPVTGPFELKDQPMPMVAGVSMHPVIGTVAGTDMPYAICWCFYRPDAERIQAILNSHPGPPNIIPPQAHRTAPYPGRTKPLRGEKKRRGRPKGSKNKPKKGGRK